MVASVIGKIARKMVKSRNTKGKRTDLARERAERNLNKKRAETKVTKPKVTKPKVKPPKGPKPTPPINKGGAKKLLKKYGVPASLIAGLLATRDTKKSEAKKAPAVKPTVKKSTRKAGPSGPTMTSMRAPSTGPKPRNKNVTKRPKGPSKQGSFGR